MKDNRKGMPTEKRIREYWASQYEIFGHYLSPDEVLEEDVCMACGMIDDQRQLKGKKTERAHIIAVCDGGSNEPSNLHMLCSTCHKDSEFLTGEKYFKWLYERQPFDAIWSNAIKHHGLNPSKLYEEFKATIRLDIELERQVGAGARGTGCDPRCTPDESRRHESSCNCQRARSQRAKNLQLNTCQTKIEFTL